MSEDYLAFCTTGPAPPPPSESAAAVRRLAQDMERQHYGRFQALAQSFLSQCGADACASLRKVMEELVGDGQLNWGRVVSLFTFTGVLARQLQEKEGGVRPAGRGPGAGGEPGQVPGGSCRGLAETIADYLGEEKKDWLLENGGWVSVVVLFVLLNIDLLTTCLDMVQFPCVIVCAHVRMHASTLQSYPLTPTADGHLFVVLSNETTKPS